jgi:hypothetical protein
MVNFHRRCHLSDRDSYYINRKTDPDISISNDAKKQFSIYVSVIEGTKPRHFEIDCIFRRKQRRVGNIITVTSNDTYEL